MREVAADDDERSNAKMPAVNNKGTMALKRRIRLLPRETSHALLMISFEAAA